MAELVSTIEYYLEFLIVGSLVVAGLAVSDQQLIQRLFRGIRDTSRSLTQPTATAAANVGEAPTDASASGSEKAPKTLRPNDVLTIMVALSIVFAVGVAVNSTTYWMTENVHLEAILTSLSEVCAARPDPGPTHTAATVDEVKVWTGSQMLGPLAGLVVVPFGLHSQTRAETRAYYTSLFLDRLWEEQNHKSHGYSLSSTTKQDTIVRGLIVLALVLVVANAVPLVRWREPTKHGSLVAVGVLLYLLMSNAYWGLELVYHRAVFASMLNAPAPDSDEMSPVCFAIPEFEYGAEEEDDKQSANQASATGDPGDRPE